jgi:soluble lytic murein transglycosylase-like protein
MDTNRFGFDRWVVFFTLVFIMISFTPSAKAADLYSFVDEEGVTYYTNIPGKGRVKVLLPLKESITKPPLTSFRNSNDGKTYEPVITAASQRFAVDPDLIRAVIKAESNFNHRAVSPKGAMGLMQLMPKTAKEMAVANPFDPGENIHAGARYLGNLLQLLEGNLPLALAAYNAGPERVVGRNAVPAIVETRDYVRRVMANYKNLKSDIRP